MKKQPKIVKTTVQLFLTFLLDPIYDIKWSYLYFYNTLFDDFLNVNTISVALEL